MTFSEKAINCGYCGQSERKRNTKERGDTLENLDVVKTVLFLFTSLGSGSGL